MRDLKIEEDLEKEEGQKLKLGLGGGTSQKRLRGMGAGRSESYRLSGGEDSTDRLTGTGVCEVGA